jgi:hypothetical protein
MNRILRLVTTFAVTIITLTIVRDYGFIELLQYTSIIWLVINFITETVIAIVLKIKYEDRLKYIVRVDDKAMTYELEVREQEEVISNQVIEIDNLHKRMKILEQHDNARINIGDMVTSLTRLKPSPVCEIKLIDNVVHYRLSPKGKPYKREEIRKVDKIEKR